MDFPERADLKYGIDSHETMLEQLKEALNSSDSSKWKDEPNVKIDVVEKQKEFFWIRIYLIDEDDKLKPGDIIHISYRPTNEKLEMIFGGYEKEGLNRNHNDEVINYVNEDDNKILCCMIDLNRVNKENADIPTIKTFFRNSRHYKEDLFYKEDIVISTEDTEYEYSSIAF
tara:strand:+ start:56215 stop:56727 length:513 start_codon:yes stop_codon:yes gene_type:complete